jgi:diguanylate cyclase (GGDEF)-like protein
MFLEVSAGARGATRESAPNPGTGRYDQLWQLSMADPHTGLANQLLLLDRLTQALVRRQRHGGGVIVFHIEFTNLGEIYEEHGYTTGNAVLIDMSRRLTSILRSEDTVGRVRESELVAVMAITDAQVIGLLTQRLRVALSRPIVVDGRSIRILSNLRNAVAKNDESAEDVLARAKQSVEVTKTED